MLARVVLGPEHQGWAGDLLEFFWFEQAIGVSQIGNGAEHAGGDATDNCL